MKGHDKINMKKHMIYKFYNKNDQLLYIGITNSIRKRLHLHKQKKEWFNEINKILVSEKLSRNEAYIYEIFFISNEKPIHNIEYTKGGEIDFLLPNITFSEYKKKIKKRNKNKKIGESKYSVVIKDGNITRRIKRVGEMKKLITILKIIIETRENFEKIKKLLKQGQVIKNYKELCKILDMPIAAGNSKILQLKELKRYCKYKKDGNKIIIAEIYDKPLPKIDFRMLGNNNRRKENK